MPKPPKKRPGPTVVEESHYHEGDWTDTQVSIVLVSLFALVVWCVL